MSTSSFGYIPSIETDSVIKVTGEEASNAISIHGVAGVITVPAPGTLAAGGVYAIAVTNPAVLSTSVVHATVTDYAGTMSTQGLPVATVDSIADGSFTINLVNAHPSAAFADVAVEIAFTVV